MNLRELEPGTAQRTLGEVILAVDALVRFEDGRTGSVRAELAVVEAKTYAPAASKVAA